MFCLHDIGTSYAHVVESECVEDIAYAVYLPRGRGDHIDYELVRLGLTYFDIQRHEMGLGFQQVFDVLESVSGFQDFAFCLNQ